MMRGGSNGVLGILLHPTKKFIWPSITPGPTKITISSSTVWRKNAKKIQ